MASVNWMKATVQKAGAMKRHLGQAEREQGNHSNEHIQRELSSQNYAIGCSDYAGALERMKARTKAVDEKLPPKRVRKDRVTCCFLELPCPRELTEQGMSDEFFKKAHSLYEDFFGMDNVHGSFIHKDEVHEYVDKDGNKKMSCEHAHTLVSAFTEDKGINGKAFETRARIRALNVAMCDMCMREFGISLNTGETPERKSAETLKAESKAKKELGQLQERIAELQKAEAESRDKFLEANDKATEAEARASTAIENAEAAENRVVRAEQRLEEVNALFDVANEELKIVIDAKARASEIRRSIFDRDTQSYHANMLESTRAIGHDVFERMQQSKKDKQETVVLKQEIERKRQEIEPLYQEAKDYEQQKALELKQVQKLRQNIEKEIEERVNELSEKKIQEMFDGASTKREKRLEAFCNEIKFSDGTSVLKAFEEQERELKKHSRGYER